MAEAFYLSAGDVDRLRRFVRLLESDARLGDLLRQPSGQVGAANLQWVQLSSTTQSDGRYPGHWYLYDPAAKTFAQRAAVWIVGANGATLTTGVRYDGRQVGYQSNRPVFQVDDLGAGGGGAITVQEADGSPSVTGVTTLKVDQTDGLLVTGSTPSATIGIQDASDSVVGIVSIGAQRFAGTKTFRGGKVEIQSNDSTCRLWFQGGSAGVFTNRAFVHGSQDLLQGSITQSGGSSLYGTFYLQHFQPVVGDDYIRFVLVDEWLGGEVCRYAIAQAGTVEEGITGDFTNPTSISVRGGIVTDVQEGMSGAAFVSGAQAAAAPTESRVPIMPAQGVGWRGNLARKPDSYPVHAIIAHWEDLEHLRLVVELLRCQSVRPYVCVIDTGSSPETLRQLEGLRAEDLEIHTVRSHGYFHSSGAVTAALDLGHALADRAEYAFHTHTDCFPRRRGLLRHLLQQCHQESPVVSWRMSPRPGTEDWKSCPGHCCMMVHLPTLRRHRVSFSLRKVYEAEGLPLDHVTRGWPDTESGFGLSLQEAGITPTFLGDEANDHQVTDWWEHVRCGTGWRLYGSPAQQRKLKRRQRKAATRARRRLDRWWSGQRRRA